MKTPPIKELQRQIIETYAPDPVKIRLREIEDAQMRIRTMQSQENELRLNLCSLLTAEANRI